jgi:MFS transporter, MFS domain-containing protein family, molybdate-anion transporter
MSLRLAQPHRMAMIWLVVQWMMLQLMDVSHVMALAASPRRVGMAATNHPSSCSSSITMPWSLRQASSSLRPRISDYGSKGSSTTTAARLLRTRLTATTPTAALLTRGGGCGGLGATVGSGAWMSAMVSNYWPPTSPSRLFNLTLFLLAALTVTAKILQRVVWSEAAPGRQTTATKAAAAAAAPPPKPKPANIQALQWRFLSVFWLLRCSDWLQGPYFYEVYASKVVNGVSASLSLVSRLFLTGFASTALFGPMVGRAADQYGRKKATLAFTVLYALGALSTKSMALRLLLLGRVASGIGTSLLFSAPESWLVAEAQNSGDDPDGTYLGETFAWAYAGDSIVAIAAGQMAATTAAQRGPTGPFELSTLFLGVGAMLAAVLWNENKATLKSNETTSIREAVAVVRRDPKIMLVGAVQSLFEAAMYIFVLQWPPAMDGAIQKWFGSAVTPYGTIFSCFMACCLLGSTMFGQLAKMAVPIEHFTVAMLTVATVAMSVATWTVQQSTLSLPLLMGAFFAFEACVGMYFPSIGTLRSRYVPDSHRSVIMNLFGIPLNVLVVSVFLSIQRLGIGGALSISSGALAIATLCMYALRRSVARSNAPPIADFVI